MANSMTAFARSEHAADWGVLSCEIRSVNHRYLDLSLHVPDVLHESENDLRTQLRGQLGRGKVDLSLRLTENSGDPSTLTVNEPLLDALVQALDDIGQRLGPHTGANAGELLRWPGLVSQPTPASDSLNPAAVAALDAALKSLVAMRAKEGQRLAKLITERLAGMRAQVAIARARRPLLIEERRERLLDRLASCREELDPNRLEQEMLLFAQRIDTDEELDRLEAHLEEVEQLLHATKPIGRRLDFLMQELNREANTLGSKANDLETTRAAVTMKVLIEQMREQVQNIE